jgi:hypothetical protein
MKLASCIRVRERRLGWFCCQQTQYIMIEKISACDATETCEVGSFHLNKLWRVDIAPL